MSRDVNRRGRKQKPPRRLVSDYTAEENAARLQYSEIPTVAAVKDGEGKVVSATQVAAKWIAENLGLAVSEGTVRRDTELGLITTHLVAGKRHYSPRSLYEYAVLNSKTDAPRQTASA
ncbi:hypothetical protein [Mycolicibacterium iranicum]|uniref:hypothetical protein n=1 Tax=Mycolicibacterium iranicum TaxID=912594 RepID=UPI0013A55CE6|nr:hypothetical protein [Mycolicibacterium iranicum]